MQFANRCAPWEIANGAENLVLPRLFWESRYITAARNTQKTQSLLLRHTSVGVPRDRYLGSPLARWLLPSNIHTASTVARWNVFTELLPGNALIKSITRHYDGLLVYLETRSQLLSF
jgi:hypothetical protein